MTINSQGIVFSFPQQKKECETPHSNILSHLISLLLLDVPPTQITALVSEFQNKKQKANLHIIKGCSWSNFFYVVVDDRDTFCCLKHSIYHYHYGKVT